MADSSSRCVYARRMAVRPPLQPDDRPRPAWWVRFFALVPVWMLLLTCVVAALGVVLTAGDGRGDNAWSWLCLVGAAAIPTAWCVLRPLWKPDPNLPTIFAALQRTVLVPALITPLVATVSTVVVLLPPVADLIVRSRRPDGWHYTFSVDDGHPVFVTLVLGGLANWIVAMLVGLALSVVVVIPWVAFVSPRQAIASNMLDTSPEHLAANTRAMRFFAVLILLVFLVPTFIVVGSQEAVAGSVGEVFGTWFRVFDEPREYWADLMWMVGLATIPVGIVLLLVVRLLQRPDRALRAAAGVNARGDQPGRDADLR